MVAEGQNLPTSGGFREGAREPQHQFRLFAIRRQHGDDLCGEALLVAGGVPRVGLAQLGEHGFIRRHGGLLLEDISATFCRNFLDTNKRNIQEVKAPTGNRTNWFPRLPARAISGRCCAARGRRRPHHGLARCAGRRRRPLRPQRVWRHRAGAPGARRCRRCSSTTTR